MSPKSLDSIQLYSKCPIQPLNIGGQGLYYQIDSYTKDSPQKVLAQFVKKWLSYELGNLGGTPPPLSISQNRPVAAQ